MFDASKLSFTTPRAYDGDFNFVYNHEHKVKIVVTGEIIREYHWLRLNFNKSKVLFDLEKNFIEKIRKLYDFKHIMYCSCCHDEEGSREKFRYKNFKFLGGSGEMSYITFLMEEIKDISSVEKLYLINDVIVNGKEIQRDIIKKIDCDIIDVYRCDLFETHKQAKYQAEITLSFWRNSRSTIQIEKSVNLFIEE